MPMWLQKPVALKSRSGAQSELKNYSTEKKDRNILVMVSDAKDSRNRRAGTELGMYSV